MKEQQKSKRNEENKPHNLRQLSATNLLELRNIIRL